MKQNITTVKKNNQTQQSNKNPKESRDKPSTNMSCISILLLPFMLQLLNILLAWDEEDFISVYHRLGPRVGKNSWAAVDEPRGIPRLKNIP